MITRLRCVVLDCADAVGLSRFYQSLRGGVVNQPDPRWSLGEGRATLHTDGRLVLAFEVAVLAIDETSEVKKGTHPLAVQRQDITRLRKVLDPPIPPQEEALFEI
ncbi:hypothetical protein ABZ484_30335 [Streptomyces sp. NPDC006393]|uniref:hypothetical protein n=1 Tax=Streptomyces sp. NPDC006393 TaxID=3156763 RepID=UPI0034026393